MRSLKKERGVISLEASIVLPLFIFLLLFFYGFIVSFSGQQAICHSIVQSADSLSLDTYALERINSDNKGEELITNLYSTVSGFIYNNELKLDNSYFASKEKWYADSSKTITEVKKRFTGFLVGDDGSDEDIKGRADRLLKYVGVQNGYDGLDFSETTIDEANNTLNIVVKYKEEYVFNFQGLLAFDRRQEFKVKLWK